MAKSLMIIDDSATMRKIIMRTMRMSGLEFDQPQEAGNGKEALEKLSNGPVDIVLCDINMPEMNGMEFVKKARARKIKNSESESRDLPHSLEREINQELKRIWLNES